MKVRFWGSRGSIPSPGPSTARYGGNTTCIEVGVAGRRLIFDAGSGIRPLGQEIARVPDACEATLFLTHFHWDHIQGFPFFEPLHRPGTRLRIVGPMQKNIDIKTLVSTQMSPVYFPVPLAALAASMEFTHLNEGSQEHGGCVVSAIRVRHPSFTVAYRVEAGGRRICLAPDNELVAGEHEVPEDWRGRFVEFIGGADLLVHDAMYTEEEYRGREGWGHSTFDQALTLAADAGVRKLLFFHHAPERADDELDALVDRARREVGRIAPGMEVDAAREGDTLTI